MSAYQKASRIRGAIVEAFIDLLEEKAYEKVTVKELVDRCNIARSTFYLHFQGTIDVLGVIEETLLSLLSLYVSDSGARYAKTAGMPFESMENWFEICIEHERVLRALLGPNGDPYFATRLQNQIRRELNQMMDDDKAPRDKKRPYYVELLAASYIGLMNYIIKEENKAELFDASELASIANSTRAAYYRLNNTAPSMSDERLFGTRVNEGGSEGLRAPQESSDSGVD